MVYLYAIIAVLGITILVNIYYSYKRRNSILTLWDRQEKLVHIINYHNTFTYFYERIIARENDKQCVDDITWNDLNMNKVFDKINYTFTSVGEEMLYYRLKMAHKKHLYEEELIDKITRDSGYRLKLSYALSKLGKAIYADSSKYIYDKPHNNIKKLYFILSMLPLIGLITMIFSFTIGFVIFLIFSIVNSFLFYITRTRNSKEFESLFYCLHIILASRKLAKLNNDSHFLDQTKKLKNAPFISVLLLKDDDPTGTNLVLQLLTLIKSIFLIDYLVFHFINHALSNNRDAYALAWRKIGEIDCCYSIALWRKTLPFYCMPTYADDKGLTIHDAYHPLLSNPVGNSFSFDKNILLTGSNASGKSTFIKTIALNIILAQSLNTSTSQGITLSRGLVYSSMAMSDDIEKGQSYFLSEIAALKRVFDIRNSSKDVYMYLFIDEIFKGTNTLERISAADAVLRHLSDYGNTRIMAATHDLELTDKLAVKYANYHFREQIEDDRIIFDYLVKEGPSKTKNAIELLRITGFPDQVYQAALHNTKRP